MKNDMAQTWCPLLPRVGAMERTLLGAPGGITDTSETRGPLCTDVVTKWVPTATRDGSHRAGVAPRPGWRADLESHSSVPSSVVPVQHRWGPGALSLTW